MMEDASAPFYSPSLYNPRDFAQVAGMGTMTHGLAHPAPSACLYASKSAGMNVSNVNMASLIAPYGSQTMSVIDQPLLSLHQNDGVNRGHATADMTLQSSLYQNHFSASNVGPNLSSASCLQPCHGINGGMMPGQQQGKNESGLGSVPVSQEFSVLHSNPRRSHMPMVSRHHSAVPLPNGFPHGGAAYVRSGSEDPMSPPQPPPAHQNHDKLPLENDERLLDGSSVASNALSLDGGKHRPQSPSENNNNNNNNNNRTSLSNCGEKNGNIVAGENQENKTKLHFPWMKTTKSHAHQWKAHWPGTI